MTNGRQIKNLCCKSSRLTVSWVTILLELQWNIFHAALKTIGLVSSLLR